MAPYSVEIRLGVTILSIGAVLVGVVLMISLWVSITTVNLLATGHINLAQGFFTAAVSSTRWYTITSWLLLVLGGIITGYAFLRCAFTCDVGRAKGGAIVSIIGFIVVLLSHLIPIIGAALAFTAIGLIVALAGFYKVEEGFLLMT